MIRIAVALVTLWAGAAHADLPPGVYAVVCGRATRGDTAALAMAACVRSERKSGLDPNVCSCKRNADLVTIARDATPALYLAGSCGGVGATREAARSACEAQEPRGTPGSCACGKSMRVAYGPFRRKRTRRPFDNAAVYRYLVDDGEWMDEHGIYPCFPAGTPVLTPTGNRAIETLGPGDLVQSLDERGRLVTARIVRVKERRASALVTLTLADGTVLRATPNHPLAARGGWVPAGELRAGEPVVTVSGPVEIAAVAETNEEETVYDLTVEPTHAFIAAGVAVHNY